MPDTVLTLQKQGIIDYRSDLWHELKLVIGVNVPYSREVFTSLMPQVDSFVKHLLCHRAVQRKAGELLKVPFWSLTSDAHLLQAVVFWCKVFGATGTNETHWQHLALADIAALQDSFRVELSSELGLDSTAWTAYHAEVTDFRNKFAAHTEIGFSAPVPKLDLALDISFLFDRWVRGVIAPDTLEERPLVEVAGDLQTNLEAHIESLSKTAREPTPNYAFKQAAGRGFDVS